MNKFLYIILISTLFACETKVLAEESATQILSRNFKKIDISDGNLSITMNDSGRRYLFEADGKDDELNSRVLEYGETVILDRGFEKAAFINRGLALTISKLEEMGNSYEMKVSVDLRSSAKDLIELETKFLIKNESIEDVITSPKKAELAPSTNSGKEAPSISTNKTLEVDVNPSHALPSTEKPSHSPSSTEKSSTQYRSLIATLIAAGIAILYVFLRRLKKRT